MAVKSSISSWSCRSLDMRPNFGDDRGAEGDVGYEMAVHNVDMEPVCAILDCIGAGSA